MKRLTLELFQRCPQFVNPLKEREVDLRGQKLQRIEGLSVMPDGFDTLDLSDNEIRRLENFPLMRRLKTIYLHRNHIEKICAGLGKNLPNLHTLALHRNGIKELADLDGVAELPSLRRLALLDNPVTKKPNYRLYVIAKAPQVVILDFNRIKDGERQAAMELYGNVIPTHESLLERLQNTSSKEEIDEIEALLKRYYGK